MRVRALLLAALLVVGCRKSKTTAPAPDAAKPTVRSIAEGQDHPWGIFVDGTHVYWTNKGKGKRDGSLAGAEKRDGAPLEVLATDLAAPYGIAVGKARVYYSASGLGFGGLGSVSLSDKSSIDRPARVASAIEEPWSIVVRGDELFFTDIHLRHVASAPLTASVDTGKVNTLANTDGRPIGLAVDDSFVYWADSDPGVVNKTPRAGGPITTLVARGDKTTGIAIDDAYVYYSEWGSGRIGRVLKSGGGMMTLAADQKGVRAIAVDDARLYWSHPPTGTIRSMPKGGGPSIIHASDLKHPYSIAVDDTSIYWAEFDGGVVRAINKR